MKKFFNLLQWAVLIALLLYAMRVLTRPIPPPHYVPETWTSWNGFYAISYAGVSREKGTDYVTPRVLAEHLKMLRNDGYESIRPEDALAFLEGRAPLPAKAVLLLFEGGRKDSYLAATPLLRQFGQLATMCIPTSVTRRWGSFYLHDNDLAKFLKDPHWNLASMGHEAILDIPVASNRQGRFLSERLWNNGQVEDDRAFRSRLVSDFAASAQILERIGHTNVIAYLFPYADAGSARSADPLAAEILATTVSAHHRIAFSRSDDAFNGPDSDPFQLSRIRVRTGWTADDLRKQLAAARPRSEAVLRAGGPDAWALDGAAVADEERLDLEENATAWLQGSSTWANMDVRARLRREAGAAGILYLRYAGPSRTLRISMNDEELAVQERFGSRIQTLATLPADRDGLHEYDLNVRLRGNRMWLYNGGERIAGPLPLTRSTTHGRVGFECTAGRLEVTAFSAAPRPQVWVESRSYRALPDATRAEMAVLLLPWLADDRAPALGADQRSELLAAAAHGVEVIPVIDVRTPLTVDQAAARAGAIAAGLGDIVAKALVRRLALAGPSDELAEALREYGFRLVRTATPDEAMARIAEGRSRLGVDTWMLAGNGDEAARAADALLRVLPSARVVLQTDDEAVAPPGIPVVRRVR